MDALQLEIQKMRLTSEQKTSSDARRINELENKLQRAQFSATETAEIQARIKQLESELQQEKSSALVATEGLKTKLAGMEANRTEFERETANRMQQQLQEARKAMSTENEDLKQKLGQLSTKTAGSDEKLSVLQKVIAEKDALLKKSTQIQSGALWQRYMKQGQEMQELSTRHDKLLRQGKVLMLESRTAAEARESLAKLEKEHSSLQKFYQDEQQLTKKLTQQLHMSADQIQKQSDIEKAAVARFKAQQEVDRIGELQVKTAASPIMLQALSEIMGDVVEEMKGEDPTLFVDLVKMVQDNEALSRKVLEHEKTLKIKEVTEEQQGRAKETGLLGKRTRTDEEEALPPPAPPVSPSSPPAPPASAMVVFEEKKEEEPPAPKKPRRKEFQLASTRPVEFEQAPDPPVEMEPFSVVGGRAVSFAPPPGQAAAVETTTTSPRENPVVMRTG